MMKVLTIGATGRFAGLVVPELKKRDITVYALVQDNRKAEKAIQNGADKTVIGNLDDKESLQKAAIGMDGVFHILPAFRNEVAAGLNMVQAATDAGVKKFVFSSVYHPSLSLVNHAEKRYTEEALYRSKMDYSILQPAMYMQMLPDAWKSAKEQGQIIMPYSKFSKMSYVDYRDVAEAAALAMTNKELSYGTFELCSGGMYSRVDLAELMSLALGKNVQANEIPTDQWSEKVQIPAGELRDGLIAMNKEYDQYGFSGGNALVLKTILGREPRTIQQFIKELKSSSIITKQLVH
jgi:uncharacterized protein YbjT (DUF2867 family)